ncbi:MAG: M48 family metalloprotease [Micavibrio aeruginosavorus]|uniref:M48 family metalloprotease n=1 Tax=Micavibrio aeruginosavorus TaxID=349221 RepID=A0A7T5UGA1_9BACT|nr:MAG: M48 family metalloprotease [Micavibrio aeruginosavorus]
MIREWPVFSLFGKMLCVAGVIFLSACSTNPATGESQFTALMSPAQENQVGAQEHRKVMKIYGVPENSQVLQSYLNEVGQAVARNTERPDVRYTFTLLDSPMVNAFALPGGYVYVTRGLMALANSEAELAGVIAHEIGHITGRHSAERYSHAVVTSLGAIAISAALDSNTASQALGVGSELYMSSYSRKQEAQADDLGIRYLHKAGYDTFAMASFLNSLDRESNLNAAEKGQGSRGADYFATHPKTTDRVQQALMVAGSYPENQNLQRRNEYLQLLSGMAYGDSARQGFVRDLTFWHPQMDFTFTVPEGFSISNQPSQVVAASKNTGALIILDAVTNNRSLDAMTYLTEWLQGKPVEQTEALEINGKSAATATLPGVVQGQAVTIRLVAVNWAPGRVFRLQMAIPQSAGSGLITELKRTTYSLRSMTDEERRSIRPLRIQVVMAKEGDTVAGMSSQMALDKNREECFRVLNGLEQGAGIVPNQLYKIITE